MLGEVHDTHTAMTEDLGDAIVPDPLADALARRLRDRSPESHAWDHSTGTTHSRRGHAHTSRTPAFCAGMAGMACGRDLIVNVACALLAVLLVACRSPSPSVVPVADARPAPPPFEHIASAPPRQDGADAEAGNERRCARRPRGRACAAHRGCVARPRSG